MGGMIIQLPESVANQIAAGEVVERPVAVVKELVENALDAGARSIEVHFERGGKSRIRVLDDGSGMSRGDALLALKRHATSKIRKVDDILALSSFGFRGEALPSIASVSRFTLRTRLREAPGGTEIQVDGGRRPLVRDCGMSPGTEVTVADLFHGVPARRKFMKTDRTESAHILQMCRLLAVAHPEVGFCLIEDGHEVFRTPPCPDRAQRVREIFGKRRVEDLLPFEDEADGLRLEGLVGRPGVGRHTRAEMVTYVNRRPVESRLLSYALIESYHRFLPKGRYPMAFLFVEVPPAEVDVNVHPTKREVRFRNEPRIRSAVMSGLAALLESQSRKSLSGARPVDPAEPVPRPAPERLPPPPVFPGEGQGSQREWVPAPEWRPPTPAPSSGTALPWTWVGPFRGRLGLFESPDGLIILNPRAARERILLERVAASLESQEIARQGLLIPPLLELPPVDASLLGDQLGFFRDLGFSIEAFGRNLFRIREAPSWMQGSDVEAFVAELVNRIRNRGLQPADAASSRSLVARLAAIREAPGAAPAGPEDWRTLARQLLGCANPLLDARGRPTFIELRHPELDRKLMLGGFGDGSEGTDDFH